MHARAYRNTFIKKHQIHLTCLREKTRNGFQALNEKHDIYRMYEMIGGGNLEIYSKALNENES